MARLRTAVRDRDRGVVPVPLTDPRHPVWRDPVEFAAMCAAFEVSAADSVFGDLARAPWPRRFEVFRERWCMVNGYVSTAGYGGMDFEVAEAAGVNCGHGLYRLRNEEDWRWVG